MPRRPAAALTGQRRAAASPPHNALECTLRLPPHFRSEDILAFHRRDREGVAERVVGDCVQKGLVWDGQPACLSIRMADGLAHASLLIDAADGGQTQASDQQFVPMVRRMLGLDQNIEAFEALYRDHPCVGALLARQAGLRVPMAATPFEALTWAITGQQISVAVAISLRRKWVRAANIRHSSGLLCHPDAAAAAALGEDVLKASSFSATKARTLINLSGQIAGGALPLDDWLKTLPIEAIRSGLLAIKGIGPWTVDYALLRGFGWMDGSLHGDVAVRRGIQALTGSVERISEAQAREWLLPYAPWRALLAAHL
ncbi:MAG TPA: AlkA N-terminal domain-containing protein, partial [Castellaniella sp.]|nr:AlkA N-terminal domain-containing protein [Castellaniella sp.]